MTFRFKNLKQSDEQKIQLLLDQIQSLKTLVNKLEKEINQKNEEIERLKLALKMKARYENKTGSQ